jgi:hypothetical protein
MNWYVLLCNGGKPLLGGLTVEDTALKDVVGARNKPSLQWRLICVGKWKDCI